MLSLFKNDIKVNPIDNKVKYFIIYGESKQHNIPMEEKIV